MTSIWEIKSQLEEAGRGGMISTGGVFSDMGQVKKKKAKQKKKQKEKQIKEQKKAPRSGNSAGDLFEMVKLFFRRLLVTSNVWG